MSGYGQRSTAFLQKPCFNWAKLTFFSMLIVAQNNHLAQAKKAFQPKAVSQRN
jgi:hypothetical protein